MPSLPAQLVQLKCPSCGRAYQTQVYTILDAHDQPEAKQALMMGQLNLAVCPHCGAAVMLAAPLLYHDAQKQLCLVYFPQEATISQQDQETFIGDATQAIGQTLPHDAPRGYLLTPRRFMTLVSLIDAILEADGVPREVVEQQRRRVELISLLAGAMEDEQQLVHLVEQYRDELNEAFFATLSAFIEASSREQRDDSLQVLESIRSRLLELTGFEQDPDGTISVTIGEVMNRMEQASDEELEELVAESRHLIDYGFSRPGPIALNIWKLPGLRSRHKL